MEQLQERDEEAQSGGMSSSGSRPDRTQTPATPESESGMERENEIRRRAYELYEARGGRDGSEMDDWLAAEQEVSAQGSSGAEHGVTAESPSSMDDGSQQAGDSAAGIPTSREPSVGPRRTGRSRQSPPRTDQPPR